MHGIWIANLCRDKQAKVFIHDHNGQISGFVTIRRMDERQHIIDLIAVRDEFQRAGIGRILLSCALQTVPSSEMVMVATQIDNKPAISLYKSAGFSEAGGYVTLHLWKSNQTGS
jgi:ribosomal protein S18 acetylase RimI-like enzyme